MAKIRPNIPSITLRYIENREIVKEKKENNMNVEQRIEKQRNAVNVQNFKRNSTSLHTDRGYRKVIVKRYGTFVWFAEEKASIWQ